MMRAKTIQFSCRKPVEFSDTDMAGIVHFSTFFKYMEYAEARLMEQLGVPILSREGAKIYGWPRVEAHCQYLKPLRFPGLVNIQLSMTVKNNTRLYYDSEFTTGEPDNITVCARGKMTTAYAVMDDSHKLIKSIPIPDEYLMRLTRADQTI